MAANIHRLNTDINSLTDSFANLVRSARFYDEADETRHGQDRRVPGEIAEVLAEKVVAAGQSLLLLTRDLKRNAALSDYAALNAAVAQQQAVHTHGTAEIMQQLRLVHTEVADLLKELEDHFYASECRPESQPAVEQPAAGMQALYRLAAADRHVVQ